MTKKIDFRVPIIIILTIILIIMCYFYFKDGNYNSEIDGNMNFNFSEVSENLTTNSNKTTISVTSEVMSALSENIELHATYYFQEKYVKKNQLVKAGDKILKYTNGKYLTAPYDCVITDINIPEESEKCTNDHYIGISAVNNLKVQFKVDETKINSVTLGQQATINIDAYENKTLQGCVTNISSTANKGKFTVTVEFENDGDIMIGMTANVTIIYEDV